MSNSQSKLTRNMSAAIRHLLKCAQDLVADSQVEAMELEDTSTTSPQPDPAICYRYVPADLIGELESAAERVAVAFFVEAQVPLLIPVKSHSNVINFKRRSTD